MEKNLENFEKLVKIIKILRAPDGCPWDIEQTPFTMRESILEEAYEVIDAIEEAEESDKKDFSHICEELGDLLFNVLMVSYMFEQSGEFSIADVIDEVTKKIIRRHPHVFGKPERQKNENTTDKTLTPDEVLVQWDKIKTNIEKRDTEGILSNVPKSFPAIFKAYKMQKKLHKVGFDFDNIEDVRSKVDEELSELDSEVKHSNLQTSDTKISDKAKQKIEAEIGDILFSVVNLARRLKVNPELALNATNKKFEFRVKYIETEMAKKNLKLSKEHNKLMDELWEESKNIKKKS